MANQNNGTPWPVWAFVSITVALIGAYAVIESNKNKQSAIPEIKIVDERKNEAPSRLREDERISTSNSNETENEASIPASQKLIGLWESNVVENGVPLTILLNLRPDGSSIYQFINAYGSGNDYGTWQYSNGVLHEVFSNGASGKARIKWISNDRFELTILDNGVPSYTGLKRYYQRKF